jgi:elongation factor Ts
MADFSLEDLKTLRERLGTGMVETKNALVEAGGDLDKATELLRRPLQLGRYKRNDRHPPCTTGQRNETRTEK